MALQGTQAQLPPYPDVLAQLVKSCWNSWRELLTALTRSEIKHAISRRASARTAWKVLKDPRCAEAAAACSSTQQQAATIAAAAAACSRWQGGQRLHTASNGLFP